MWASLIPWLVGLFTSGAGAAGAAGAGASAAAPAAASPIVGGGPLAGAMKAVAPAAVGGAAAPSGMSGVASAAPSAVSAVASQAPQKSWFTKLEDAMLGPEVAKMSPEESQPARWAGRLSAIAGAGRGGGVPGAIQGYMGAGEYMGQRSRYAAEEAQRKAFEEYLRTEAEKTTDPEEKRALKIAEFTHNYSMPRRGTTAQPRTFDKPLGDGRYQRQMYRPDTGALEDFGSPYVKEDADGGLSLSNERTNSQIRDARAWLATQKPTERKRIFESGDTLTVSGSRANLALKRMYGESDPDYEAAMSMLRQEEDVAQPYTPPPTAASDIDKAIQDFESKQLETNPIQGPQTPSEALTWSDKLRLMWGRDWSDLDSEWDDIVRKEANRLARQRAEPRWPR